MSQSQVPNETERSNTVRDLLEDVLPLMGISAVVEVSASGETINADITGQNISLLTSAAGKGINALQCLANVVANRNNDAGVRVIVDAGGYRAERKNSLEACAGDTADRAVTEDKEIAFEPMNAFERRIIHCALADRTDVITDSRGEDPYRCVIVIPAPAETE